MTTLDQAPKTLYGFAEKIFNSNNGTLLVMSAPPSFGIAEVIDALLVDKPIKVILFPALVSIVVIAFYGFMFTLDFVYGLYASRYVAGKGNKYFESSKGYSSIFKAFAVVSLIFMLSLLSITFALVEWDWTSKGCMIFGAAIGIMGGLFDFGSIGENYEKIHKKQPRIFILIRSLTEFLEEELTLRVKSAFQALSRKTPPPAI